MRNTFKILFYVKKNAPLRSGEVPIMGRITINGQRTQFSTQLTVSPTQWSTQLGQVAGRGRTALRINERLAHIRFHVERCYNALFAEHAYVTPRMVKELYFGIDDQASLVAFFRSHNEEFARMVGVSRSRATYYKYRCVCRHLESFIRERYDRKDLLFKELDRDFLTGFHAYIMRDCGHKKNTTWVYMIALKHIFMLARSRGLLTRDLFANYKLHSEFVARNYLSASELTRLMDLQIGEHTLQLVRDAFVFSCFTGLSYIDIRNLTLRNVRRERQKLWLCTTRRKTGSEVNVRLFAVPCAILLKYAGKRCEEPIFDLPSNGWCNLCLNRLTELAGIEKQVTFHLARHTFATTITLSQGVAIETISKLLGHKNIRTTQIYATITHARLDGEMERLSKRIDSLYGARESVAPNGGKPCAARLPEAGSRETAKKSGYNL